MKILQVHNSYKVAGGEDIVVFEEKTILENNEIEVITYYTSNEKIDQLSSLSKLLLPFKAIWSASTYKNISNIIDKESPDICHIHNVFPLISPSVYYACQNKNVPVVQTIHNYRFMCPNGIFFRNNNICEDCTTSSVFKSVKHKCYRNSYVQSFVLALSIFIHQKLGTFKKQIDSYLCLTQFSADKFMSQGYDQIKILVKPNFKPKTTINRAEYNQVSENPYFLYLGRINEAKGSEYLISLALEKPEINIKIIGEGETKEFEGLQNVEILGKLDNTIALKYLQGSIGLLFPSRWYEGLPIVLLEALSYAKPVISSDLESLSSVVINNYNGLTYEYNNKNSFIEKAARLWGDSSLREKLGKNAELLFRENYSAKTAFINLFNAYHNTLSRKK